LRGERICGDRAPIVAGEREPVDAELAGDQRMNVIAEVVGVVAADRL
jgi:hypothetical protein